MEKGTAYEKLSWPEVRDLPKDERVAVIPVGAVEQHGHHLPLDTDNTLVWTVCSEAARSAPDDILLLPLVPYGACEMMMDYPGTISIGVETLASYIYDIVKSLARHGFLKVLIVNGHGGNIQVVDLVGRKATAEMGIDCASVSYWFLIAPLIRELRDSEPGGICHACELETSLHLHIDGPRVQMDKAVKDQGYPSAEFFGLDIARPRLVSFSLPWSKFSKTGAQGDPTVATAEKGEKFLNGAVERLVALVREFKGI